ncbi:MAG TPA: Nramp family divalent metal transporter [Planctomycetaceae bacterium]|nr:Nramp family divalent metal transporter [Planctomycetaceae bacterium]
MPTDAPHHTDDLVPDAVIPHQHLPPLRYRDLPDPVPWRRMVGPSIMLAGLALGSGEFVMWPYITFKAGFVFFWACMLGVVTQFFLNMEIERWTLATGEGAITGFCRLSRHWAWVMLILNILPWAWPGWATGAGQILSWIVWGPSETVVGEKIVYESQHVSLLGIAGLLLVGGVLTAGPVVYQTVEKIQMLLVSFIVLVAVGLAVLVVRPDAVAAMARGTINIGQMPDLQATGLSVMALLGALAFAGAGGTTNLGQSNLIRDKGYGMGRHIGRITSPITGQEEAIPDVGYHFRHTPENMARWRQWWRAANIEHFFSFLLTCIACLCLMSLIAYSLLRDSSGALRPGMDRLGDNMDFVWGEALVLGEWSARWGGALKLSFLLMGVAVLLTTELGVLDVVSRISAEIVKVNWLRDSSYWTQSRLYYCFLWGEIALGVIVLSLPLLGIVPRLDQPLFLLRTSAAMNGGVMFLYSVLLLYMNNKVLSRSLSMSPVRFVAIVWSCAFFGYFTIQALQLDVLPLVVGGEK